MKYKVKYYDVWYDEISTYECKADNKDAAEISFRKMFLQTFRDIKY